jgi:hypothetical protein
VNAKRTSTRVDSSTNLRTTRRHSKRVSKLALFRVKVATIGLSLVAFVASLLSIAAYNPGTANTAPAPAQAQTITIVQPGGSVPLQLAPPPRVNAVRPFVRSRGS